MKTVFLYLIVSVGNDYKILVPRRAKYEMKEEHLMFQSFLCIFQPSLNGKMKKGESVEEALERETREEWGNIFAERFFGDSNCKLIRLPKRKFSVKGKESIAYSFLGEISDQQSELMNLYEGSQ